MSGDLVFYLVLASVVLLAALCLLLYNDWLWHLKGYGEPPWWGRLFRRKTLRMPPGVEAGNKCCGYRGFYLWDRLKVHYELPKFGAPGRMMILWASRCPSCGKEWDQQAVVSFDPYETVEGRSALARYDAWCKQYDEMHKQEAS